MTALCRRLTALVGLLALAGLLGPGGGYLRSAAPPARPGGQAKPPGAAGKPLQYEVTVALKLVQVYVTGKDGKPAGGLDAGDFEVFDNGKRVTVTHFEKHFPESVPEASAVAAPEPGPRLGRKFFLLFDLAFIEAKGFRKAKDAALRFIDKVLRPGDEVGLMTYTPSGGLLLYEYLTADHGRVRRLVEGFGLEKSLARAGHFTDFEEPPNPAEGEGRSESPPRREAARPSGRNAMPQARRRANGLRQGYEESAREFIDTLTNLAIALRYVPGYKNVILFSGGIAKEILYGRSSAKGDGLSSLDDVARSGAPDDGPAETGLLQEFARMAAEFKASDCPIFACDVSGSQKAGDVGRLSGGGFAAGREFEGGDSLRQMASVTGGRYFGNTIEPGTAASGIEDMTGAFYVLGYSIAQKWDGAFHRIDVKVRRKDCRVIAQGGYFSPKPFKDYTNFEKLLHVTDLALSDSPQLQVPAAIPVMATAVTVKGKPRLLVFARAARAALGDVLGERSEAYVLLGDERGEIAAVRNFRLDLSGPPREIYVPSILLDVDPGRYTCRMVLRNMETGKGARGAAPALVPEESAPPADLDPPLLLVSDDNVQETAATGDASIAGLYGYDAASFAPAAGSIRAGTDRLFAALRWPGGGATQELPLKAALRNEATGFESEPALEILKDSADGETRLTLVSIAAGGLQPGPYNLTIKAGTEDGLQAVTASVRFEVR